MSTKIDPMEEAFSKAKKVREKSKEEVEESNNSNKYFQDFERMEYVGLEDDKNVVLRIVGSPLETRIKNSDVKLLLQSKVLKDDKSSYINVNWPHIERRGKIIPDPDWFLTKVFNKVNEGKWENFGEKDLQREGFSKNVKGYVVNRNNKNGEYSHYNENKDCYKRLSDDGNTKEGDKYYKRFYPTKHVLMNVIDKNDSWCKENKHLKILTSRKTPYTFTDNEGSNKTIYYCNTGISYELYNKIFEHFIDFRGDWDIDVVLKKIKIGSDNKRDYIIKDATDIEKLPEEIKKVVSSSPLSEEEKTYVLYDLDKLFNVTSYQKLKRYLSSFLKLVDYELGTSFEDELAILVQKEKDEKSKNDVEEMEKIMREDKIDSNQEGDIKEDTEKTVENTGRREREEEKDSGLEENIKFDDSVCQQIFPCWDKVPENEKKVIIENIQSIENTVPTWIKEDAVLSCVKNSCCFVGTTIETTFPCTCYTCPVCGEVDDK